MFGHFDLATVGVLSAATVLSMSIVSMFKARKSNVTINITASSMIAVGSIVGGIIGKALFNYIVFSLHATKITAISQSIILVLLLSTIYIYFKKKDQYTTFVLKNTFIIFSVGILLGVLAAFLGIGGGPLNVAVLSFLFSMNAKNASINSIFIIFFSQLSALLLIGFTTGFEIYDLSMLSYMVLGGILGGWIGSIVVTNIRNSQVEKLFNLSILVIICINIYNIIQAVLLQ